MKLYLAGKMRGVEDFNFPEFNRVAKLLRNAGYFVFNPAEKGMEKDVGAKFETLAFRRKVFAMDSNWICLEADGVALISGWGESAGAKAENALAIAIGLPTRHYSAWLKEPKK